MDMRFPEWYRIVDLNAESERLEKRWKSLTDFIDSTEDIYEDIFELIKIFYDVPITKDDYKKRFGQAFLNEDVAFNYKAKLEMAVLAGATLFYIIDQHGKNIKSTIYYSILSIRLIYPKSLVPQIEAELIASFRESTMNIREKEALINWNIAKTPKLEELTASFESNKTIHDGNYQILNDALKSLRDLIVNNNAKMKKLNNSLLIYKEESQILWWLIGEYSNDFKMPLKEFSPYEAAIILGKELADLVTILPGPYSADALIYKMLASCKKKNKITETSSAIFNIDIEWRRNLVESYSREALDSIAPLMYILKKSLDAKNVEELETVVRVDAKFEIKDIKVKAEDLAYGMYIECMLYKSYMADED